MKVDEMLEQIEAFLEWRRKRPKSVRVLDAILEITSRGRDHLKIWESLRALAHDDPALIDVATMFFIMTGLAHLEAATLHAAKLVETQSDSVNVTYLLNEIEAARNQDFLKDTFPNVRSVIAAARERLKQMQETVTRIKDIRDRDLAHLDRSHINAAEDLQAVEVNDLYEVFNTIERIATELASASSAFAGLVRSPTSDSSDYFGSVSPQDLIYFARTAFRDPAVASPNARIENLRELDRAVRKAKAEADSLGGA